MQEEDRKYDIVVFGAAGLCLFMSFVSALAWFRYIMISIHK